MKGGFYRDPTEDYELEPSDADNFWNSQDDQTQEAKIYVKELEKRLGEIQKELFFLSSLCKQTKLDFINWKIQLLINKTKL